MSIRWSKPYQVKQGRKKNTIPVETALMEEHPDRFHLYGGAGMIPTMWTLFDQTKNVQYFLYADGWANAREVAGERIEKMLKEQPAPKRKLARKRA